jgi:uncharacterized protein (DUF2225 family)
MSDDLFNNLKFLNLDGLSGIELYQSEQKNSIKKEQNRPATTDYLFDRKVICPVCSNHTNVRAVKSNGIRVISRDTDFMTHYEEPNPMLYDVWVCSSCGYAAISSRFNSITDKQAKLIQENITSKWDKNKKYPQVYNIDTALETHQLALLNAVVRMAKDSEKALICLKLAWLYRLKNDCPNENKFLSHAQEGFILALEKESPPIAGLNDESCEYLIGELHRRLGNNSEALKWFSKVLCNPKAKQKIKDMARDQKDLILKQ